MEKVLYEKAYEKTYKEAYIKSYNKAKKETTKRIAKNLVHMGMEIDKVSFINWLSATTINAILRENY